MFKSGDFIEWVEMCGGKLVDKDEELYSTIENKWVPIGSNLVHMCINVEDDVYTWLNEKGLFSAHVDDTASYGRHLRIEVVTPR